MKAIYLKEMRSYFHSLAAYIYFALFIAATGVYLQKKRSREQISSYILPQFALAVLYLESILHP